MNSTLRYLLRLLCPAIGLRRFNIFDQPQHPYGTYAAEAPKWIAALIKGYG